MNIDEAITFYLCGSVAERAVRVEQEQPSAREVAVRTPGPAFREQLRSPVRQAVDDSLSLSRPRGTPDLLPT